MVITNFFDEMSQLKIALLMAAVKMLHDNTYTDEDPRVRVEFSKTLDKIEIQTVFNVIKKECPEYLEDKYCYYIDIHILKDRAVYFFRTRENEYYAQRDILYTNIMEAVTDIVYLYNNFAYTLGRQFRFKVY